MKDSLVAEQAAMFPIGWGGLAQTVLILHCFSLQHASSDVERMILGNKCDMNDKRQVSKERGEKVSLKQMSKGCSPLPFSICFLGTDLRF